MTTPIEQHIVAIMRAIRPEWDVAGCVAALRKLPSDLVLAHVVIAAVRYATDEMNLTPQHLVDFGNRAWDSDWYLPCRTHPDTRSRRMNGECAACYADRVGTAEPQPLRRNGTPPTPEQRKVMLDAIHGGNHE